MNGAQGTQHSALLIGVGNYSNPELPPLAGPSVDLRNMKAALENPQIGGYSVSTLEDVDSPAACLRIEEFLGSRSEDETVVLYYSGHGFIDRRGALYLCTTNSSFSTPRSSSIRADFVTDLIDNCASRRVLLLLDCCYSGNFEGAAKATSVIEPQFKGTGLGRVVLTAGAGDQLAWDLGDKGSLFSRHIVNGLTSGAADLDQDGRVTVQELYDYVYREVTKEQPRQRPGKWTYREDGPSFLIAQSPIQPKRELPPELLHDLESDFPKTRASVLRELEGYARRNAWALDAVIEKLRAALNDDSDSVKIAAREILARLTGGTGGPPLKSAAPVPATPKVSEAPRESLPFAAPSTSTPAPAMAEKAAAPSRSNCAAPGELASDTAFPLRREIMIWAAVGIMLPQISMRLFTAILPNFFAGFAPMLLTLLILAAAIASRYRVVDGFRVLIKRPAFIVAAIATILFALITFDFGRDEVVVIIYLALAWIALAAIWMSAVRLHWGWTILLGLVSGLITLGLMVLGFRQFQDPGYYSDTARYVQNGVWFCAYTALVPLAVLIAAIARNQFLTSRGQ